MKTLLIYKHFNYEINVNNHQIMLAFTISSLLLQQRADNSAYRSSRVAATDGHKPPSFPDRSERATSLTLDVGFTALSNLGTPRPGVQHRQVNNLVVGWIEHCYLLVTVLLDEQGLFHQQN